MRHTNKTTTNETFDTAQAANLVAALKANFPWETLDHIAGLLQGGGRRFGEDTQAKHRGAQRLSELITKRALGDRPKPPLPSGTRVRVNIAQGGAQCEGIIRGADYDEGWIYHIEVVVGDPGDEHRNGQGELWVCDFAVTPLGDGE
jgi:hypothetical protein